MEIKAPYLPYDVLRERAEKFLGQYHPTREIPVPIEEIIEFQFQMDIVPEPGLREHFDVDSYITSDLEEIRVDEFVCRSRPGGIGSALLTSWGTVCFMERSLPS